MLRYLFIAIGCFTILINLVAACFVVDGYFLNPGKKTISLYDLYRVLWLDLAAIIIILIRTLKKTGTENKPVKRSNVKFLQV